MNNYWYLLVLVLVRLGISITVVGGKICTRCKYPVEPAQAIFAPGVPYCKWIHTTGTGTGTGTDTDMVPWRYPVDSLYSILGRAVGQQYCCDHGNSTLRSSTTRIS